MQTNLFSALLGTALVGHALADPLANWLGGGDCPWAGKTAAGSHPTRDMPVTGVTRYYDFTIARATLAPDGVQQSMIVVNGQFPGPLIEANWGDWIEVNVHNAIQGPEDLTSIHWHGLNQPGTPFYDGVVTVDQCPIIPGTNLTYRYRADEYGTSWYHAHYSAQYASGVQGPIVIHGPADYVEYDADLGVIQVTDWFHDTYDHLVDLVLTPTDTGLPYRPFSDSNLVAGVGQYPCANVTNGAPCSVPAYASWEFGQGKTYRLRFVNTGASAFETISIDGHSLTVIANDFVPVQPYQTQYITLGVGQRTDVLVTASAAPGSYWLRAYNQPQCGDSNGPDGRGIIYYSGIDPKTTPTDTDTTGSTPPPVNVRCQNDALASTVPMYAIPAAEPDTTITLTISGSPNTTGAGAFHWTFNDVAYNGNLDAPLLFDAVQSSSSSSSSSATTLTFAPTSNVYNIGTNDTVRIIVYNTLPAPHPMHLHGHDFQVLAEGSGGLWDGTIVNPANPQRRDVHMSWSGANASDPAVGTNYMVLQFAADNAGVWPFHCHIAWHLSAGMAVMILERPDEVAELEIPAAVTATCDLFKSWQATNPTTDVDDGLKKRKKEKRETLAKRMVDYMKGAGGEHVVRHVDKHRKRGVRGWGHVHEREL
ncbi:hypothetical protein LTR80_009547 [Exophiala xenobiotica]